MLKKEAKFKFTGIIKSSKRAKVSDEEMRVFEVNFWIIVAIKFLESPKIEFKTCNVSVNNIYPFIGDSPHNFV